MADYFEEARQTDTTMTVTTMDAPPETTALAAPTTEGSMIMAYPPGVSLATITIGAGRTMFGAAPKLISATVTPIFMGTPHVVHAASGWAFYPTPRTFRVENGEELSFELPHVDAEGWRDTAGNEFPALLESGERDRGWAYHAKFTVIGGSGQDAIPHRYEKIFQPLVGQTEPIDVDLVPDGKIGSPVSAPVVTVTSIAGLTGPVSAEQLLALGLGGIGEADVEALATAAADQAVLDAGTYTDEKVASLIPGNGQRPVGRGELEVSARDFGAVGDGITDDTAALNAFLDYITANKCAGFMPGINYRITGTLIIPSRPGWTLRGNGNRATLITQDIDNTPIIQLGTTVGSQLNHFTIQGLWLTYKNFQPATNTNANCIVHYDMAWQARFLDLGFKRGHYGSVVRTGVGMPWGTTWDDIHFGNDVSGGAMDWSAGTNAVPNNHFGRFYVELGPMSKTVFHLRGYNWVWDTLELIEASVDTPKILLFMSGTKLRMGTFKVENAPLTTGKQLVDVGGNSYIDIGHVSWNGGNLGSANLTTGTVSMFALGAGASPDAHVRVGSLEAYLPSDSTSSLHVYRAGRPDQVSFYVDRLRLSNGWKLNSNAQATDTARVGEWMNGRVASPGDADYTVALGDANVNRFTTAYTAPRTITLPTDSASVHTGLTYDLVFDGAINGANTATVKSGATTLRTVTENKVYLRYMWQQGVGWVLTGNTAPAVEGGGTGVTAAAFVPATSGVLGNRWVFLGDSITAGSVNNASLAQDESFPLFVQLHSRGRIWVTRNAGVGGNTSAQMLARFDTDVTPFNPQVVFLMAGVNDIAQNVSFATFKANVEAIRAKAQGIGAALALGTLTPTSTADRKARTVQWNHWLRKYAADNDLPLVDTYEALVDPVTGSLKVEYDADGIHPTTLGRSVLGKLVSDQLASLTRRWSPPLVRDAADTTVNMFASNPLFLLDTNSDGVPDSWAATGGTTGITHSLVDAQGVAGKMARIQVAGSDAARTLSRSVPAATWAVGDKILVAGVITTDGGVRATVRMSLTGGAAPSIPMPAQFTGAVDRGVFGLEFTVTPGTTNVALQIVAAAGTGTVAVGQLTMVNLTRQEIG